MCGCFPRVSGARGFWARNSTPPSKIPAGPRDQMAHELTTHSVSSAFLTGFRGEARQTGVDTRCGAGLQTRPTGSEMQASV